MDTLDKLEVSDKLVSITADNASSNSTLAARVKHRLGGIFEANSQLLGCMAHVINLAAHDGIKAFGADPEALNNNEGEMTLGRMDIAHLVDLPDGRHINLQTIVSRTHGLATYICNSPQRREAFKAVVDFVNSQARSQGGTPHTNTGPATLTVALAQRKTANS